MVSSGWDDISSRCYRPVPHIHIIYSVCFECMSCPAEVYRVCHVAVCSCTTFSQAFACLEADWCVVAVHQVVTADMTFFPFVLIDTNGPASFDRCIVL